MVLEENNNISGFVLWAKRLSLLFVIVGVTLGLLIHYNNDDTPIPGTGIYTMEASQLAKIGQKLVKSVATKENVAIESLWKDQTVVIAFLRRFGCIFCRQQAQEISALEPILTQNNVKLVGIGLEELGVEEFVSGNYLSGDLYIDNNKEAFKEMGFNRASMFSLLASFLKGNVRAAHSAFVSSGLSGNLKGDGGQNGGTLIVTKGGEKVLMAYRQPTYYEHVENSEILKALGISVDVVPTSATKTAPPAGATSCDSDTCSKPTTAN